MAYIHDYLLNGVSKGTTWADEFWQECDEDPARFGKKTIRRTEAKTIIVPQKHLKVLGTSRVFGSATESTVGAHDIISCDNVSSHINGAMTAGPANQHS